MSYSTFKKMNDRIIVQHLGNSNYYYNMNTNQTNQLKENTQRK